MLVYRLNRVVEILLLQLLLLLHIFTMLRVFQKKKQFYISPGFAHGFLVLSDVAEFCYKCTDFYHPEDEGGIAWNDPTINVVWPQVVGEYKGNALAEGYTLEDGTKLTISDKDQKR